MIVVSVMVEKHNVMLSVLVKFVYSKLFAFTPLPLLEYLADANLQNFVKKVTNLLTGYLAYSETVNTCNKWGLIVQLQMFGF